MGGQYPTPSKQGGFPVPANDNRRKAPVVRFPVGRNQALRTALQIGRKLGRATPLGRVLDAYQLAQYLWNNTPVGAPVAVRDGMEVILDCGLQGLIGNGTTGPCSVVIKFGGVGNPEVIGGTVYGRFYQFIGTTGTPGYDQYRITGVVRWPGKLTVPRNAPSAAAMPHYRRGVAIPAGQPVIWPGVDPLTEPRTDPAQLPGASPDPRPLPYRAIPHRRANPYRPPGERWERGPLPMWPGPRNVTPTVGLTIPHPSTGRAPSVQVGAAARGSTLPPKRTKERKMAFDRTKNAAFRTGDALINLITESGDFIDAIYKALPKELRKKHFKALDGNVSDYDKAVAIWKNFDKVDAGEAVANLGENAAKDSIVGKYSKMANTFNKYKPGLAALQTGKAL